MELNRATAAINAGLQKSYEIGTEMNIAIVDVGGNLKAFVREEFAWLGSIDIAIKKAKTAVFFNMDTDILGKLSQPGESLYGIEHSNNGLITFAGGIPIKNIYGELVGAVGVSGSTIENDKIVAQAVADFYRNDGEN